MAILLGILLSLLAVGGYIAVESTVIRPAREIAVGHDTFWHPPSQIRQLIILTAFCLPATFGAIIAAWFARRPVFAAGWVIVAYFLVLFAPLLSDDNLPFPLTDVVDLQPWIISGVLLVNLVILSIVAAIVVGVVRTAVMSDERSSGT